MNTLKILIRIGLAALALLAAPLANAWNYTDGDALLIFRASGHNDVEFDLGNINQFLNKANGYNVTVTNWSLVPVTTEFGADLTGVSIALLAVTPKDSVTPANQIAWVSSGTNVASVADLRNSAWQSKLWSTVNSLGAKPSVYLLATSNAWYSIATISPAAYDIIAPPTELGGNVPFSVEQVIPGTLKLWAIQASPATPIPNASPVGTFAIAANGTLTFTADNGQAVAPPSIKGVTRSNGVSYVTFTTISGGTYQLLYTTALGSALTNWPAVGSTVTGDGTNQTLAHTNAAAIGFYGVVRSP